MNRYPFFSVLLLLVVGCRQPGAVPWEQRVQEASRQAWTRQPATSPAGSQVDYQASYLAGFQDGAAMIHNALRERRVPFLLKTTPGASAMAVAVSAGNLPPGATLVEDPFRPEVDPATGFPIHAASVEHGNPFSRGQEAGFQWALAQHRDALGREGLLAPRPLPGNPAQWIPWPEGREQARLSTGAAEVVVYWTGRLLAWESRIQGFPARRTWRSGHLQPRHLGLAPDALWLELETGQAVALDLATGLVRDVKAEAAQAGFKPEPPPKDWTAEMATWRQEEDAQLEALKPQVALGDPVALLQTARILASRTSEDKARAFRLYAQAAEKGSADGHFEVGLCHFNGIGVPADPKEARRWLESAARLGHPRAPLVLQAFLESGKP